MTEAVTSFVDDATKGNVLVAELVRNKAVSRQYHTWFQWEGSNANSFFALFGSGFRDVMKRRLTEDDEHGASVRAFLELGRERNRLVHQDFGTFPLEKTTEEIHALYLRALRFVEAVPGALREFDAKAERAERDCRRSRPTESASPGTVQGPRSATGTTAMPLRSR